MLIKMLVNENVSKSFAEFTKSSLDQFQQRTLDVNSFRWMLIVIIDFRQKKMLENKNPWLQKVISKKITDVVL